MAAVRTELGRLTVVPPDVADGAEGARQGDPGVVVEVGIDVAHSQPQAAAEQREEVVGPFDVGLGHVEVGVRIGHEGRPGIGGKSGTGAQAGLIAGRVHRRGEAGGVDDRREIGAAVDGVFARPVARRWRLALKATPLTFWFSDESQSPKWE